MATGMISYRVSEPVPVFGIIGGNGKGGYGPRFPTISPPRPPRQPVSAVEGRKCVEVCSRNVSLGT